MDDAGSMEVGRISMLDGAIDIASTVSTYALNEIMFSAVAAALSDGFCAFLFLLNKNAATIIATTTTNPPMPIEIPFSKELVEDSFGMSGTTVFGLDVNGNFVGSVVSGMLVALLLSQELILFPNKEPMPSQKSDVTLFGHETKMPGSLAEQVVV
jgi:hypothetical protein